MNFTRSPYKDVIWFNVWGKKSRHYFNGGYNFNNLGVIDLKKWQITGTETKTRTFDISKE